MYKEDHGVCGGGDCTVQGNESHLYAGRAGLINGVDQRKLAGRVSCGTPRLVNLMKSGGGGDGCPTRQASGVNSPGSGLSVSGPPVLRAVLTILGARIVWHAGTGRHFLALRLDYPFQNNFLYLSYK